MTIKYMKRVAISLIIRVMQIKESHNEIHIRWLLFKKQKITNVGEVVEKL